MSESEKDRKEKDKSKKTTEQSKRRGFYAALYSCVGLTLTLAVVIGYRSFITERPQPITDPDAQAVSRTNDRAMGSSNERPQDFAYLTPEDRGAQGEIGEPLLESSPNDTAMGAAPGTAAPSAAPNAVPGTTPSITRDVAPTANPNPTPESEATPIPGTTLNAVPTSAPGIDVEHTDVLDEKNMLVIPPAPFIGAAADETSGSIGMEAAYNKFAETDRMDWPLTGEIVMAYSVDHVIYDRTLDQYRTNNSISIAAQQGTEVRAAAEGVVLEVTSTRESGKTVVVEHGNGWRTTYSQLQDNVLVAVGSVVTKGQIIGGVGEPSLYSVLLGPHLQFAVARDGASVNPKDVLVRE